MIYQLNLHLLPQLLSVRCGGNQISRLSSGSQGFLSNRFNEVPRQVSKLTGYRNHSMSIHFQWTGACSVGSEGLRQILWDLATQASCKLIE